MKPAESSRLIDAAPPPDGTNLPADRYRSSSYSIKNWPKGERPRERLLSLGAPALATRELIGILLGSGRSGGSAVDLGETVLRRGEGSLRYLASLPPGALTSLPGIGTASTARILAALELGRRVESEAIDPDLRLRTPQDVFVRFGPRLRDLTQEEFHALLLTTQHRVIRDVLVTRGILDASLIHAREVFKAAVVESAAAIILVHNHPSGDPSPSPEDRAVTRELSAAGRLLGIPVLDHVVIGGDRFVSLSQIGWFDESSSSLPVDIEK